MSQRARVQARLWTLFRRLDPARLFQEEPGDGDALGLARTEGRTRLALGTYSRAGLEYALRAYGTLGRLEAMGIGPVEVKLDLAHPYLPRLLLVSPRFSSPLLEVAMREITGRTVELPAQAAEMPLLYLESLLLQNPGRSFTWHRPPLPGQQHPGLMLSSEILQILLLVAKRIRARGVALRPSTFHAAWAYARHFQFVDGAAQLRFDQLRSEPRLRPLWLLSWALELGCVRFGGERVTWTPEVMVAPLDAALARTLEGAERGRALRHRTRRRYAFDLTCLRRRFPWERMPPLPMPHTVRALLRPPHPDHH